MILENEFFKNYGQNKTILDRVQQIKNSITMVSMSRYDINLMQVYKT